MPRFHFDVEDGKRFSDAHPIELPDLPAVKAETLRRAFEMLGGPGNAYWNGGMWTVRAIDDGGIEVFRLSCTATIGLI